MFTNRRRAHLLYFFIDVFLILFSFYLPYTQKYFPVARDFLWFKEYTLVFFAWGLALIFILNNYHLYVTDRSLSIPAEAKLVIKAVFFSSVIAVFIIFGLQLKIFSRHVFVMSVLLLSLSLSLWRAIKRVWVRHLILNGDLNLNVLIVGAGESGLALAAEMKNLPFFGFKIIGFLDDNKAQEENGFKILGKIKDMEEVVRNHFIDEIFVTIPSERKTVSEIIFNAKKLRKSVRILADSFDLPFGRLMLNYVGNLPLVAYYERKMQGSDEVVKRALDALLAGIGLVVLSPLFAIIALLIKLDSPGPVFYISPRCGKKGKVFSLYKFRSMSDGADKQKSSLLEKSDVKGPIFKMKNDPRMTPIGKYLRRYSLDELPQLINVLKGEMSLVGPRPPTPDEVQQYYFRQMRRLEVRPGITCLSQVRGRSDLSFNKWVKWDSWYIDNWSLGLDLRILLLTMPVVLKKKGAY